MERFVLPPRKRRKIKPSQLPVDEQAGLFYEIQWKRQQRPPMTWAQIADEEGFAQRTLEYFHRSWTKLEENRDRRSPREIYLERFEEQPEPPASADPRPDRQGGQDTPRGSGKAAQRTEPEERVPGEEQHEAEHGPGADTRRRIEALDRLDEHREAARQREDALRQATLAQAIAARQALEDEIERLREIALRQEEEGVPQEKRQGGLGPVVGPGTETVNTPSRPRGG
jgi:hypothetical protein